MGLLEGKVAVISGAARGQGRAHALRLAREGADIIAIDICADIDTVDYPLATPEDLDDTVAQIELLGRRVAASETDVRDATAVAAAIEPSRCTSRSPGAGFPGPELWPPATKRATSGRATCTVDMGLRTMTSSSVMRKAARQQPRAPLNVTTARAANASTNSSASGALSRTTTTSARTVMAAQTMP